VSQAAIDNCQRAAARRSESVDGRWLDDRSGHWLDPDEMILDLLHTWNVFGRNAKRLPLTIIEDRA
jgi:hypothetical protein